MDFSKIAPYLSHPLVLVGFALFALFGLFRALLRARIVPQVSQRTGGLVVRALLRYGFWISLIVILLGFGLAFYQTHIEHSPEETKAQRERLRLEPLAAAAKSSYCQQFGQPELSEAMRQDMIHACAEAIHALAQINEAAEPQLADALALLLKGDPTGAKAIFAAVYARNSVGATVIPQKPPLPRDIWAVSNLMMTPRRP